VGQVAYKLALPAHSTIHPVFHVSQLKKAVGADQQVSPVLPSDFSLKLAPEQVLQTRLARRGTASVQQVLVKWNNLPTSLATWEDYEALRQEFPRAAAWGQAAFQGGGDVSTSHTTGRHDQEEEADDGHRPKAMRPSRPNARYAGNEWAK